MFLLASSNTLLFVSCTVVCVCMLVLLSISAIVVLSQTLPPNAKSILKWPFEAFQH